MLLRIKSKLLDLVRHSNDNKPQLIKDSREIAQWLGISPATINQTRKVFSTEGLEAALYRKTRIKSPIASKITGDFEAKVIATALVPPPDGYARWTLRLLAEYCMDEKPLQLLREVRERIAAKPLQLNSDLGLPKPGYCEKIDSEYVRHGTASIFMFTEPLGGWRHAYALSRHAKGDYAKMTRQIAEEYYPDCKKIILVSDNLSPHSKSSFYEAFSPNSVLAGTKI